jgi:hypothetical protein
MNRHHAGLAHRQHLSARYRPACVLFLACKMLLVVASGITQSLGAQTLHPLRIDRAVLQGIPHPGMLRPSSMAIDERRGLVYVAAPAYSHIAVIDVSRGEQKGIIPLAGPPGASARLHCVEPASRSIIMSRGDAGADARSSEILSVSVLASGVVATRMLGQCRFLAVVPHPFESRIIISTGTPTLLICDPSTLAVVDSIDAGMNTGGIVADSAGRTLAVAECAPRGDSVRMRVFSLVNHQTVRSFSYHSTVALPDIAMDPATQDFALLGSGLIRHFDATGIPVREFRLPGAILSHAFLPLTHQVFLLDSAGASEQGRHGRFGRLYRYSLAGVDVDSFIVGADARDLVIYFRTAEACILAAGASSVQIVHAPSMQQRAAPRLGHAADDVMTSADDRYLFIANSSGSGESITRVNLDNPRVEPDIRSGGGPVRCGRMADGTVIVFNHFESSVSLIDSETGSVERTISLEGVREGRSDVIPSIDINAAELLLTVLPEQQRYVLTDLRTSRSMRSAIIDHYSFLPVDAARGAVQAAWIGGSDMFALLLLRQRRLNLYQAGVDTMLFDIDLSNLDWQRLSPLSSRLLNGDAAPGLVFVGPYRIELDTKNVRDFFPGTTQYLGADDGSALLALEQPGRTLVLHRRDAVDGHSLQSFVLDADSAFHPAIARLDWDNRRLCLADDSAGTILVYSLASMTELRNIEEVRAASIQLYPQPASLQRDGGFSLFNIEEEGSATLTLYSASGRREWNSEKMTLHPGRNFIHIGALCLQPGVHLLEVRHAGVQRVLRFITMP